MIATATRCPDALAAAHVEHAMRFAARLCLVYDVPYLTDEAQSESMIVLVESARVWEDRGSPFTTYLWARLRGTVRNLARDRDSRCVRGDGEWVDDVVDSRSGPEEIILIAEGRSELSRARMRLTREQAKVLRARYDLGPPRKGPATTSNPSVARMLKMGPARVKKIEEQALVRLRELLRA